MDKKSHSSVDSSALSILPLGFESQAYAFINFVLYLSLHSEKNENKQKEARFGPFKLGSIATLYNIEVYMDQICTYLMDLDNFK